VKTALQVTSTSILGLALMALTLFWPAGTIHYWQAWVFFGVFVALSVVFTAYAGVRNPEVLRRRMNAGPQHESRPVQKIVSAGVVLAFFALLVVSAFDHRFGWSDVPTALVVIGNVIAATGLGPK
jgi:protein-S-isoprenylcysteine O-methyltransferase Ste14